MSAVRAVAEARKAKWLSDPSWSAWRVRGGSRGLPLALVRLLQPCNNLWATSRLSSLLVNQSSSALSPDLNMDIKSVAKPATFSRIPPVAEIGTNEGPGMAPPLPLPLVSAPG